MTFQKRVGVIVALFIMYPHYCIVVSVNEIRRQLAQQEHELVERGELLTDGSPLAFVVSALSIEDTQ